MFLGLSLNAWLTIAIVVIMFASLLFTKVRTEVAFFGAMVALFLSGVLDVKDAFGGFSAESVVLVVVLYMVIAGLTHTGVLDWIVNHLMGLPKTLSGATLRLMLPVAALSAFLSNTTVVALYINVVKKWAKRLHIAPSKLLIPLSYASCFGGVCTIIGTPPNIIISGLYAEQTGIQLGIFTPTICGLFCFLVGTVSVLALQCFLPSHKSLLEEVESDSFVGEIRVPSDNPYIGMTISEMKAVKPEMSDVDIIAIRRFDNELVVPVAADEIVMGGDRIIASSKRSSFVRFVRHYGMKSVFLPMMTEEDVSPNNCGGKMTLLSSLIMMAMVSVSALGLMSILQAAVLAVVLMVVCRCCTSSQAISSIDWNIIIVFAGSVAMGKAIEQTGIATAIVYSLLDVCGSNPYVVLTVVCLVGTFITEFISNTAAGAMFCPIALAAASSLGVNPLTFCVALMISVSSSFATPIGSPTHMLVYAPGGYRFGDFARIGIPMNLIILAANIFITTLVFPF